MLGAGNAKPGSGSAAALQGMIAAEMIRTVIDITKGKPSYKHLFKDLDFIINEVNTEIYPTLTKLIQEDSIQFGKAIEARNARNSEDDIELKSLHAQNALEQLKIATEIPVSIARYCIRLAEIGLYIFNNCFQSARGDSSVAINGALSAVSGCLAIINLNLTSFGCDDWTIEMRTQADDLKELRDKLLLEEADRQENLKQEAKQMHEFFNELNTFQNGLQLNDRLSNNQIENLVSNIQNSMWKYRDYIWKKNTPENPIEVVDAEKLLKKLGYQYQTKDKLESFETIDGIFQTAGIIDTQHKHVSISENFGPETIEFTVAHELGHAILHPGLVLHRDRPMDGTITASPDYKERQANRFASCFLMPRKLVVQQVEQFFLTKKIGVTTQTALLLGVKLGELKARCKTSRDLAKLIASTTFYNNQFFPSLASQFHVSNETMAIRLEELQLISF